MTFRDVSGLELFRGQYCSLFLKPTDLSSMKRFAEKFAPDDPDEVSAYKILQCRL